MADYKEMYFKLFNKMTDIVEEIKEIQKQMEEEYINDEGDAEKE